MKDVTSSYRQPPGSMWLFLALIIIVFMIIAVPHAEADDYTVTVTRVQLTYWCQQYGAPSSSLAPRFISFLHLFITK
jgi:hypothetical protein